MFSITGNCLVIINSYHYSNNQYSTLVPGGPVISRWMMSNIACGGVLLFLSSIACSRVLFSIKWELLRQRSSCVVCSLIERTFLYLCLTLSPSINSTKFEHVIWCTYHILCVYFCSWAYTQRFKKATGAATPLLYEICSFKQASPQCDLCVRKFSWPLFNVHTTPHLCQFVGKRWSRCSRLNLSPSISGSQVNAN